LKGLSFMAQIFCRFGVRAKHDFAIFFYQEGFFLPWQNLKWKKVPFENPKKMPIGYPPAISIF
jgi:hypothetical protein